MEIINIYYIRGFFVRRLVHQNCHSQTQSSIIQLKPRMVGIRVVISSLHLYLTERYFPILAFILLPSYRCRHFTSKIRTTFLKILNPKIRAIQQVSVSPCSAVYFTRTPLHLLISSSFSIKFNIDRPFFDHPFFDHPSLTVPSSTVPSPTVFLQQASHHFTNLHGLRLHRPPRSTITSSICSLFLTLFNIIHHISP
jgi:hypothetical protein